MSIIYQPKGKAREYSPLAINLYSGCDHKCAYCYAPGIRRETLDQWSECVTPRRDVIHQLERDCKSYHGSNEQVLLNFMHDPYCHADCQYRLTRQALSLLLEHRIPVAILTKGGLRAVRDFDIMEKFGEHLKIGASLTFDSETTSLKWEPFASTPDERIEMLRKAKEKGIKTWASFEPVIDPDESLKVMERSLPYVDEYKVGKLNNYRGLDKLVDWTSFLERVVSLLRGENKPFYIKYDLRMSAPTVKLYGNEVLQDEFNLPPFPREGLF